MPELSQLDLEDLLEDGHQTVEERSGSHWGFDSDMWMVDHAASGRMV